MKKLLIIIAASVLSSCSASWHLNRAIMKDPTIMVPKEITIRDTFYTPEIILRDSFYTKEFDTIEVVKDKYWTKIVRVRDSIYVDGGCKSDTVYLEKKVFVPKVEYKERDNKRLWIFLLALVILLIVLREWLREPRQTV